MDDTNTPIFTHAKMEYTKQLVDILTPQIFDGIKSIYDEAVKVNSINSSQSRNNFFRTFLEKVPTWSNVIVEAEAKRIITNSSCDWLDDLITAVFISHTKILTSIGINTSTENIDLTIPKTINFIHKTYINVAREIWKNPYLYNDNVLGSEYQKNMRTVEIIIKESIENTIRNLLPIKQILKTHLGKYDKSNYEAQKRVASSDIRQMLIDEIRNLNLGSAIQSSLNQNINSQQNDVEEEQVEQSEEEVEQEEEQEEPSEEVEQAEEEQVEQSEVLQEQDVNIENEYVDVNQEEEIKPIEKIVQIDEGYESPDEEQIKKQCDNLEINDIPDVTEEKYDNTNIIEEKKEVKSQSMIEQFIESLKPREKPKENLVSIVKEPDKERLEKERMEKEKLEEDEIIEEESKEVIAPLKEVISVEKNIDDTETVDDFFNDVTKLMENKGIKVEKDATKYTLFDDADENE